jgi:hypothetical protein
MKIDRKKLNILFCSLTGVIITWFINHQLGYGAIIANGLVGIIATILLPAPLAGVAYTASFVGMSSTAIIPSLMGAALGGLIVGIILLVTTEIYSGIGGKGGTTAALASIITKTIVSFFV